VLKGEDRYHHGKALMFLANGAIAQAEIAALQAQGLDPADPRYTALVARVYQEQGYDELAISAWEQLLELPGVAAGAPALHELGRLYAKSGRPNDARQKYEQACAADSSYVPALRDLAELFRRAKRPENAARTWLRYAQVAPGDIEAHLGLAIAMNELGRRDEAAAAAKAALALSPAHTGARLAFVQAGLRSREAALRAEAAAMADSLLQSGNLDGWLLEDQLARAALMDSTTSSVPFQQGLLELKAGRAAEAATRFERAVALEPQSAGAFLNLGIARYQSGSPSAAIADFRRAVAINGELTVASLLLGQALTAVDSLAAAESTYREVLAREATNAKALRGVGFCRLRAADYPAAARAYEQSTQTEPDNADGWAGLGSAQLGQGRLDAAGAAFTKARAIDPNNAMLKTGSDLLTQARNAGKEAPSR
jgi:tetratricopeptide (TPR) repeat protein